MTTSTSNAQADARPRADLVAPAAEPQWPEPPPPPDAPASAARELPHTVWSRFIVLMICLAVVTTTLAFGTVHAWSLAAFQLSAALVFVLWMLDAWRTGVLRVSRNALQLPLLGLVAVGLVQLLPLGASPLTHDPQATRVALVEIAGLLVYFAAALAFTDSPRRLRLLARLVIVFGFLLAVYGLMQHFVNPRTIFWVREPKQAEPFGPYVNRHHFAGYMELALAMPLGLLFAGAVGRERVVLYGFASAIMAIALVMTNSRGGLVSMVCEILFLAAVSTLARGRRREGEAGDGASRLRSAAARVGLGFALVLSVFVGVLWFGGDEALSRVAGTVYSDDPTTGRAHFWRGTVQIIRDHPVLGTGLGSFGSVYPRYDTGNGTYRLEQAHNDYLQVFSDAGVVGGLLGLCFVALLFWTALRRIHSHDRFRRGVALGALGGCAGALVHSFFDFTLHTTANALLFLLLAALATVNGRVEEADTGGRGRRRRRRRRRQGEGSDSRPEDDAGAGDAADGREAAGARA
ncbi:MAG: O-antigen ligase family protein [Acidobacteria bacterium]|nr:O-antigen ligase family protein [Acidobacteriota bacterium]